MAIDIDDEIQKIQALAALLNPESPPMGTREALQFLRRLNGEGSGAGIDPEMLTRERLRWRVLHEPLMYAVYTIGTQDGYAKAVRDLIDKERP